MRLIFLSLCGLATLLGPAQSLSAQVVTNDPFVNATQLIGPSGLVSGRLSGNSLQEAGEPTPFGLPARGSVWWSWTAPFSGEGQIQVTNSSGGLRLAAFNGDTLTNLTLLASNTNATNGIQFFIEEGLAYPTVVDSGILSSTTFRLRYVAAPLRLITPSGSKLRAPGTFLLEAEAPGSSVQSLGFLAGTNLLGIVTNAPYQFQWTVSEAGDYLLRAEATNAAGDQFVSLTKPVHIGPANDDFADATEIPGTESEFVLEGRPRFASSESGEANFFQIGGFKSVWWKWTPSFGGPITIASIGTSSFSYLSVYRGEALTNSTRVLAMNLPGQRSFLPVPGATYHITLGEQITSLPLDQTIRVRLSQLNVGLILPSRFRAMQPTVMTITNAEIARPLLPPGFYLDGALLGLGEPLGTNWVFTWVPPATGDFFLTARATNSLGREFVFGPFPITVRPVNDDFADATELPPDLNSAEIEGELGFASMETGEEIYGGCCYASRWWKWVPSQPGFGRVDFSPTEGPAFSVFKGTNLDGIAFTGGNIGDAWTFEVKPGETYYIRTYYPPDVASTGMLRLTREIFFAVAPDVARFDRPTVLGLQDLLNGRTLNTAEFLLDATNSLGPALDPGFSLTWKPQILGTHLLTVRATDALGQQIFSSPRLITIRPNNDDFGDATAIELVNGYWATLALTEAATIGPGENQVGVWYAWRAPEDGTVVVGPNGGYVNGAIRVLTGANVTNLAYLGETSINDGGRASGYSATNGQALYLLAGPDTSFGVGFTLEFFREPANDQFATPSLLPTDGSLFRGTLRQASIEDGEPLPICGKEASRWFKIQVAVQSDVQIGFTNAFIQASAAVWTGNELTNLEAVVGHRQIRYDIPNSVYPPYEFRAQAGVTYLLQVVNLRERCDTIDGRLGEFELRVKANAVTIQLRDPQLLSDGTFSFDLSGAVNRNCQIQGSADFTSWSTITNILPTTDPEKTTVTPGLANRFFRVQAN